MQEQELTVLIYFASDNPLAPLVVSELKAIKDAGFQKDTTVLCLYDPMEKDVPTQLLDVNRKRKKAKGTFIGDGENPYVRNMTEDVVECSELTKAMQVTTAAGANVTAFESLRSFIEFALQKRAAKNYMLILLGHGMIVGNDTFLPDGDTDSAITLKELKKLCAMFTKDNQTSLRLLGLHSCSMSSIEVAYELKGKADYMLATQGTMFVNGWPYRQFLKKTLNHVEDPERNGTNGYDTLIGNLYFLCLYNFTDFMTAGYSCDIALCDLRQGSFDGLKKPLQDLVAALKPGLLAPGANIIKDLVLLAHWDAQSFWSENYTDLWDFCDCLANRCIATNPGHEIIGLCQRVKDALTLGNQRGNPGCIVRHADNFGTEYQYARGLSIYFPWHRPFDDKKTPFKPEQCLDKQTETQPTRKSLQNYRCYDFTREFGDHHWLSFLEAYWDGTQREARKEPKETFITPGRIDLKPHEQAGKEVYDRAKELLDKRIKRTPELKKTPDVGTDCICPTIKNYPTTRELDSDNNVPQFSITPGALKAFLPTDEPEKQ